jgi:hypothetical protein
VATVRHMMLAGAVTQRQGALTRTLSDGLSLNGNSTCTCALLGQWVAAWRNMHAASSLDRYNLRAAQVSFGKIVDSHKA